MIPWLSILFFNLLDWGLTYYAVTHLGALEIKPPLTWLIREFGIKNGLLSMLIVKVVLQFAVLLLPIWGRWTILVVFILVCAWNIYQLVKK